jgi:hypothetical protein
MPLFSLKAERRSINDIFPGLEPAVHARIFSNEGYYTSSEKIQPSSLAGFKSAIDPQIIENVFSKQPGFVTELVIVIPGSEYSLLDVYNAIGNVRELKGRVYHSASKNDYVPLFEDATRLDSARRNTPVPDPAPASQIPSSETVYMRLRDTNFGNSFYRGDMALSRHGLRYSLSNNRNLTYLLIPVIREGRFNIQLYFEPLAEGMMIYSLAGADVSDFVSSRIHMPSAISKRLAVIIDWIAEGIQKKH